MSSSSSDASSSGLWSIVPVSTLSSSVKSLGSNLSVPSLSTAAAWTGAAVAGYCLWEQLRFMRAKRCRDGKSLPGPDLPTPVLGGIVEMVKDPYGFWERQRTLSFPGMSWHSIVGVFTVFVTDPVVSRHVFSHNSKDTLLMALHPSAKNVLGPRNIAFLHGPDHKLLRKSFLALFTRKALAVYVGKQDQVICQHLRAWLEHQGGGYDDQWGAPTEMRPFVQKLNAMTSQEVFAGPYLRSYGDEIRTKFSQSYRAMTDAFLALPVCLPGTTVWKGYKGRLYIIKILTRAAHDSKAKMATGKHEPECLLDFWSLQVLAELKECKEKGEPAPFYAADSKMADSVMDFLFASQDASTASLVWTLTLMAEHPDVLERVRKEQFAMRGSDPASLNAPITGELLNKMSYTRQVVKEILRFRPPAPMVPQMAQKPFKLTESYTAPKGTMIVPSVWSASMQGYENPDLFDPDRFGPERQEDVKYAPNFLVFGHGPHYCVGKEYAINHLTCFLARTSTTLNWKRQRSSESDKTIYLPTLYPGDSVFQFRWAYPSASEANNIPIC